MNREILEKLPVAHLRALDIKSPEDEKLVQEVLSEKIKTEPGYYNQVVLSSKETDSLTPEKERELQARIDGRTAPETLSESEPVEVTQAESTGISKFCDFCDSKGVRHKKNCTRLSTNEENI